MPGLAETDAAFASMVDILRQHKNRLATIPGVISAQVGYRESGGKFTTEPAIIVTVLRKRPQSQIPPHELISAIFRDLPVDVVQASIAEQLAFAERQPAPLAGGAPDLLIRPLPWKAEPSAGPTLLAQGNNYVPPTNITLAEVNAPMTVLCHVSPDAGWPTLKAFIGAIQERLTLAMYDLSAPHIVRRLGGQIRSIRGKLECIIDPSDTKNGKNGELEETDALQRLDNTIAQMDIVWASVKKTGSLFATSYHSKVAVADGRRFWLSSGNWQHSNQPDIDPINKPEHVREAKKRNREWHVIVDHPGLATMFERFIRYDRDQSRPFDNKPKKLREIDLFVASDDIAESFLAAPRQFFEPLEVSERLRVQPLLTPDNFLDHIIPLIESATERLYIQNQYFWIQEAENGPAKFRKLADAITDRLNNGVDVKLIFRTPDFGDKGNKVRDMLQTLQHRGFEMGEHVRMQSKTHTKGVIVDSKSVAIGSHNWSVSGVLDNRDASLIFHGAPAVAQYFERVFLMDWGSLAREVLPTELFAPVLAGDDEEPPPGMQRVTVTVPENDEEDIQYS